MSARRIKTLPSETSKAPPERGFTSLVVAASQELAAGVKSGGGGNCTRVPRSVNDGLYARSRSFVCQPRGPDRQGPLRLIPS